LEHHARAAGRRRYRLADRAHIEDFGGHEEPGYPATTGDRRDQRDGVAITEHGPRVDHVLLVHRERDARHVRPEPLTLREPRPERLDGHGVALELLGEAVHASG